MMGQNKTGLVWDLPTRLFHWGLVVGIAYAWFAIEILEDLEQHFWAGYFVFFLVVFRLLWGLVGSRYARLSDLFEQTRKLLPFGNEQGEKMHLGHTPQGSLSVLALLLLIGIQVFTGLFNSDDYSFAPLSGLVSDETRALIWNIHALVFDVLSIMIGIHVLAIIYYRLLKNKPLTLSMITGKKTSRDNKGFISKPSLLLALIVVLVSAGLVYGTVNCCTDTIPVGEFDF